ncbi:MAG: thiamine pyrophosphate-binding protein [Oscillospiraceae bacterium]|nr:thiamine pyrophosphate-binding protein [Oscillospiraceae bacterium]
MKVSDYIADRIHAEGVNAVFGFQGSNATHLIDSIAKTVGMRYVQNHHEQASAFAANAYASITGKIGCAVSSGGPGAINMIGGVANAWFDSVPVVFLTGQLNSGALRADKKHRQHGFQEFDIVASVREITKYAVTVLDASEIGQHLEEALFLAKNGRMGPVLLDIPHNIQSADIDVASHSRVPLAPNDDGPAIPGYAVEKAFSLLKAAKKPIMLLGAGARALGENGAARLLAERFDIPAVASLKGLDTLAHDNRLFVGFIGSYGNRYANLAISECDLLLVLGSRLDMRQIGDYPEEFAKNATVLRVDIDENELAHNITPDVAITGYCSDFVRALLDVSEGFSIKRPQWIQELDELKRRYPVFSHDDEKTLPNEIIRAASLAFSGDDVVTGDVGQNQMWTAQSIYLRDRMRLLNSGGLGSMGFSLPAAVGAFFANPKAKILAVTGDGGVQMNIQELGTIAREHIPVKILVMNNRSLGLIRTYQAIVFKNDIGSVDGFGSPDYELLAKSYGIPYAGIRDVGDIAAIESLLANREPLLAEVRLAPDTEVHPEPAYLKPVHIQSPPLRE